MSKYDKQASDFLVKHGLTLTITRKDNGHQHGDRYRVTIRRKGKESMSFDFWGSLADKEEGQHPSEYDVLAALSSDASAPTDPDEVYEEYGDMKPSQAQAVARFARRLQTFFIKKELDALMEIQ